MNSRLEMDGVDCPGVTMYPALSMAGDGITA